MKIAFFNIQNLFHRDKSFIQNRLNKNVSDWLSEFDRLILRKDKSVLDFDRIQELSFLLGFEKTSRHAYGVLRKRSGGLYLKACHFSHETKASELTNWMGWIPIQTVPVNQEAIRNKARVIADCNPDVLIVQEVEDKASLEQFNRTFFQEFEIDPYNQIMVLEGNDARGLSMGILTKNGYSIDFLKSHGEALNDGGQNLFDIDCQEYGIGTPSGDTIWVILCQFSTEDSPKRKLQSKRVASIYKNMRAKGKTNIIICGTLNDASYSDSLSPLLRDTDLKGISKHQRFNVDLDAGKDASYYRMGAYRLGVNIRQKDYLLLSPKLFQSLTESGLNRKGMWPESRAKWSVYPSVKHSNQAASRHPLLWGDMDV